MKGARGLLGGVLVLVLVCAIPAVSAAQDSGSSTTTTSTTPSDPGTPPPPAESPAGAGGGGNQTGASSGDAAAGTPAAAATDSGEPSPQLRGASPADASSGGAQGGAAHKSASTTVTMGDFFFRPATVTVSVGDIVTWRNEGHEPHTATADDGSFDTGTVPAGGRASHMFTKPGTFTYVCTIHPNMKGTVRVVGSGGGGSSSGSSSSSSSGLTEAQAVNSPKAAGDKNTLPMTGMPLVPLTLAGLALLGSGLGVRRSARQLAPGQQLSLF